MASKNKSRRSSLTKRKVQSRRMQPKLQRASKVNGPNSAEMQQRRGNRGTQEWLVKQGAGQPVQAKLTIGEPNDKYEQEADRVAEKIMQKPESGIPEEEMVQAKPLVQDQDDNEEEMQKKDMEEEEEMAQTKPLINRQIASRDTPAIAANVNTPKTGGSPLREPIRAFFEPRFGADFSQVRVHKDSQAIESARAINARAYTTGRNVVFGAGEYSPETGEGKKLLAHELSHVVQQGAGRSIRVSGQAPKSQIQRSIWGGLKKIGGAITGLWNKGVNALKVASDQRTLRDQMRVLLKVKPVSLHDVLKLINSVEPNIRRTLYTYTFIRMQIVSAFSSEDLVQVMSSILAGDTYMPGWESELYWTLSDAERDAVNRRVDVWFKHTIGVTRELDPGNKAEMPLVRHWLRRRDIIIETDIKREADDDKKMTKKEKRFSEYLKEAVTKMNKVTFGSGLEMPDVLASDSRTKIKFWKLVRDKELASIPGRKQQGMLVYDGGATPAIAIDELFKDKNLDKWTLDCIEFVQAAHMYARRHTLGDTAFNKTIKQSGGVLALRLQNSTGYNAKLEYSRSSPSASMEMKTPGGKAVPVSTDIGELLDKAPVGSRVVWRNLRMKGTDFFNENTIKLGGDSYAAHGFGEKKIFTRQELEEALAKASYELADGDFNTYKDANVFLRKIEHVEFP